MYSLCDIYFHNSMIQHSLTQNLSALHRSKFAVKCQAVWCSRNALE